MKSMLLKNKRVVRALLLTIPLLTITFLFFGQGCSESFDAVDSGSVGAGACNADGSDIIDKNYNVLPGEATVSILYGNQILDSFVSCTGLVTPSQRTMDEWTQRSQSLSEYGSLTDISGAMMMAIAAVGAEVCMDVIEKESALPDASRALFRQVNLAGAGLTSAEIRNAAQMLALSCWQRPYTTAEETAMVDLITQLNTNSANGALGLCTAMLSSLASIQQ